MTNTSNVIAADIGGTNIRLTRICDGLILEEVRHQADFSVLQNMSKLEAEQHILYTLEAAVQQLPLDNIQGVGIGFPGFFIGNSGVLAASPNIPQLSNFALATKLSDRLSMPVTAQNDALCAAIGEQAFGAGQGHKSLLHITLGTGIGGGLILNNTPYTGESGMAMEFGHLKVERGHDARLCGCGNHGCVEAYASATAISARYNELAGINTSPKEIYQRAVDGDKQAADIFESAGLYLGIAIAQAITLLDIRTVTISGGLIGAWDILHPNIMVSLNANLIPPLKGKISVSPSSLQDNAGILGASTLISRQHAV
ncbi:ROK family protein [bacterium AH-315-I20]|nr:ROK family protein [bacterium AH-315-I20]